MPVIALNVLEKLEGQGTQGEALVVGSNGFTIMVIGGLALFKV